MPFADGAYAAVICTGVFTMGHVGAEGLPELIRITRTGGPIVLTVKTSVWTEGVEAALKGCADVEVVEETAPYISMPGEAGRFRHWRWWRGGDRPPGSRGLGWRQAPEPFRFACMAAPTSGGGARSVTSSSTMSKPATRMKPRRVNLLASVTTTRRAPQPSTARELGLLQVEVDDAAGFDRASRDDGPFDAEVADECQRRGAQRGTGIAAQLSSGHEHPFAVHRGQRARDV